MTAESRDSKTIRASALSRASNADITALSRAMAKPVTEIAKTPNAINTSKSVKAAEAFRVGFSVFSSECAPLSGKLNH
jgi:hypothetical protein